MTKELISVIVPIFNTANYLERVISSLVNQTYKNIEIILVNDGSTDASEEICRKFIQQHDNIKYFYKENGGQGSARNLGLQKATGNYIMFVDSDDYIVLNAIELLYNKAKEENAELVYCAYRKGNINNYIYCSAIFNSKYDDKTNYLLENAGPCNALISKELIDRIGFNFPEDIIYEDLTIVPILGMIAKKIVYINEALYFYETRLNSTMNQTIYNPKLEDIFTSINYLMDNYKKYNLNYPEIFEYIVIRRLMSASLRFIEFNDPNECLLKIKNYMQNKFPNWRKNKYFKELPFKQKMVAVLAFKNNKKILRLLYKFNRVGKKK